MFADKSIGRIVRGVERVNAGRDKRTITAERVVETALRIAERGGYEFLTGGREGYPVETSAAFVAAIDGRVYVGFGAANAQYPSPKKVHACLSHVGAPRTKPQTVARKLREWAASGEAIVVANAKTN